MEQSGIYKYHLRPGYDSGNLLIEFITGVELESFEKDFFNVMKENDLQIQGPKDLWMNDEVIYTIDSHLGSFTLSKDIWNLAFIMTEDPQCIVKINELLVRDQRFEKIEVDHDKYWKEETDKD